MRLKFIYYFPDGRHSKTANESCRCCLTFTLVRLEDITDGPGASCDVAFQALEEVYVECVSSS